MTAEVVGGLHQWSASMPALADSNNSCCCCMALNNSQHAYYFLMHLHVKLEQSCMEILCMEICLRKSAAKCCRMVTKPPWCSMLQAANHAAAAAIPPVHAPASAYGPSGLAQ
jgi:hypothetical protein